MKSRSLYIRILVGLMFLINNSGPMPLASASADGLRLPLPGVMVSLSPEFNPPILKGIKVHTDNPFRFDFILDQGDSLPLVGRAREGDLKQQSTKLIKYFLASLTIPEKDLWVNLSPYEKDRIIPHSFGLTEMGRDLLAEDYILKQITASLLYPESSIGKEFWKRVYAQAAKQFGNTNVPVSTFNKVWILPEKAVVYENAKAATAYVVEAKLKVMLEEDYLSLNRHSEGGRRPTEESKSTLRSFAGAKADKLHTVSSQIIREVVIPQLTKEVNEGKNFAQLRQVYNSLILATWYKKKIKDSILAQVYADKSKVAGIEYNKSVILSEKPVILRSEATKDLKAFKDSSASPQNDTELIYRRYLAAFKKGVYNYIKEEQDPLTQETIPRKYFSGGVTALGMEEKLNVVEKPRVLPTVFPHNLFSLALQAKPYGVNYAMSSGNGKNGKTSPGAPRSQELTVAGKRPAGSTSFHFRSIPKGEKKNEDYGFVNVDAKKGIRSAGVGDGVGGYAGGEIASREAIGAIRSFDLEIVKTQFKKLRTQREKEEYIEGFVTKVGLKAENAISQAIQEGINYIEVIKKSLEWVELEALETEEAVQRFITSTGLAENAISQVIQKTIWQAIEKKGEFGEIMKDLEDLEKNIKKMGTTISWFFILEDRDGQQWVAGLNVGDSRIYERTESGDVFQLSKDDSLVEKLVQEGAITREQAEVHPERNKITDSLSGKEREAFKPHQIIFQRANKGSIYFSVSDGVIDNLLQKGIKAIAKLYDDPFLLVDMLTKVAYEISVKSRPGKAPKKDDISAAAVKNEDAPAEPDLELTPVYTPTDIDPTVIVPQEPTLIRSFTDFIRPTKPAVIVIAIDDQTSVVIRQESPKNITFHVSVQEQNGQRSKNTKKAVGAALVALIVGGLVANLSRQNSGQSPRPEQQPSVPVQMQPSTTTVPQVAASPPRVVPRSVEPLDTGDKNVKGKAKLAPTNNRSETISRIPPSNRRGSDQLSVNNTSKSAPSLSGEKQKIPNPTEPKPINEKAKEDADTGEKQGDDFFKKGKELEKQGEKIKAEESYWEAITAYRSQINWGASSPELHKKLGYTLLKVGKYGEAVDELEEARNKYPDDQKLIQNLVKAYHGFGRDLFKYGRHEEAITKYQTAIQLATKFKLDSNIIAQIHKDLGFLYRVQGDKERTKAENAEAKRLKDGDRAMKTEGLGIKVMTVSPTGGIDLTSANMNLQAQHPAGGITMHLDHAQLAQLQEAPGLVPVIMGIEPLSDVLGFLGLKTEDLKA